MAKIYAIAQDGTDATLSLTLLNWSTDLTNNGWTKYPNGLILQWGTCDLGGSTAEGESAYFTFPTNFLNAVFIIILTLDNLDTVGNKSINGLIQARWNTLSTFNVYKQTLDGDGYIFKLFNWIALGH
jgi:hypothetical protein